MKLFTANPLPVVNAKSELGETIVAVTFDPVRNEKVFFGGRAVNTAPSLITACSE